MFKAVKTYLLVVVSVLASGGAFASDINAQYQEANKLYQEGKFDTAAVLYDGILQTEMVAPEVYYNLGNCYYKMGNVPRAILNYERALRLAPGDDDIAFNLQLANYQTVDKVEVLPKLFIWRWWDGLRGLFSFDGWAYLGIILLLVSLIFFTIFKISRDVSIRRIMFYPGIIAAILTVLSLLAAENQYAEKKSGKEAIIFTPTLTLKSSPDKTGKDLVVVHEGLKVTIMDNLNGWSKVRLTNGTVGWVENTSFIVI